uniref:Uncharacterized protein n=1 Tax=Timema bartmani TaxID=61472 RepID=A0A7R9I6D6_9NEOP|nr:unnamed protein product [Timema bartmani]
MCNLESLQLFLSSDREKVSPIPRPLVLADQVSEPPEALHESLDRFDDQVKCPDPLQIYRAPVTLKDFLKKRQGQIQHRESCA